MSIFGLAFYFSFGGNLLIQWGVIPIGRTERRASPLYSSLFIAASALCSAVFGLAFRYVLTPWGLESLAPVVFAIFMLCALGLFRVFRPSLGKDGAAGYDDAGFQATLVLYSAAMLAGGRYSSPWFLLGGGASAAFGYLAATRFLDDIMDRLDLEPVPAPFRGAPIRFLSAGLMALAFAGVDAGFFARF